MHALFCLRQLLLLYSLERNETLKVAMQQRMHVLHFFSAVVDAQGEEER
jgi:hypothetical protein